jgi:hypothetical protein
VGDEGKRACGVRSEVAQVLCKWHEEWPIHITPPSPHRFIWLCALQVDADNTDLCFSTVDNSVLDFKEAGSSLSFPPGLLAPGVYVFTVTASTGSAGSLIPNQLRYAPPLFAHRFHCSPHHWVARSTRQQ